MRFKDLYIGQVFRFAGEGKYLGLALGPWVKRSARTYEHTLAPPDKNYTHRVGSINAEVTTEG